MRRLLLAALLAGAAATARAEDFKLVVNAANPADALTKDQVTQYFLKKTTKWPNDQVVFPVDLPETSPVRAAFSQEVLGKSVATLKAYWNRLVFAGRETPPVEKSSDDEVLAAVRANPGAIGYVGGASAASGVKVVAVK